MKRCALVIACGLASGCSADGAQGSAETSDTGSGPTTTSPAASTTQPDPTTETSPATTSAGGDTVSDGTADGVTSIGAETGTATQTGADTSSDTGTTIETGTGTDSDGGPVYPCTCPQEEACAVATSCGWVTIADEVHPYVIEPADELENLQRLRCVYNAVEAGGGFRIGVTRWDGRGQVAYDRHLRVLSDGDGISQGWYIYDFCSGVDAVRHRSQAAIGLPACEELDGSQAQGDCVYDAIYAGPSVTTCVDAEERRCKNPDATPLPY